ncbi:MAG TPA: hypothetical protein VGM73_10230 [Candidatus Didemnitutus sp.]
MDLKPAALVHVGPSKKIAATSSEFLIIMKLVEGFLKVAPAGKAQQLQHGLFLCELDACYPAIMGLVHEAKTYAACVLVAEIGAGPMLLSPEYEEAGQLLHDLGHRWQYTGPTG